ncbi:hypothetical protein AS026_34550 [Rhizobium altiplani]|uniref:Uncharacterized protein n=1 Tax=Rhizobium altiplani TaxID=1864509 RepID=A0A109JWF2_9HYPH|nr:hypothetical protein AS026_34550 [Rhizobium altiplani]MDQ0561016.1 hypothetical protein [Rhizobium mesoamericanum]
MNENVRKIFAGGFHRGPRTELKIVVLSYDSLPIWTLRGARKGPTKRRKTARLGKPERGQAADPFQAHSKTS